MNKTKVFVAITRINGESSSNIICVPSTWNDPQTFHIITEDEEFNRSKYEGEFTSAQVYERFDIKINENFVSISNILAETPNDQELGKKIRNLHNNL